MTYPLSPRILESSGDQLQTLRKTFGVRSVALVMERLLLDFELPTPLPAALPRSTGDTYTRLAMREADIERLHRLRQKLDFDAVADVVALVLHRHLAATAPAAPPATQGEQQFAAILAYIAKKEKAERAARKAARKVAQTAD